MKLKRLWIDGFKNLNNFELDFTNSDGITVLIGNNGSGKSNVLEAISAIFAGLYKMETPQRKPKFEYEIEYELNETDNYKLKLKKNGEKYRYEFLKNDVSFLIKDMKNRPENYLPSKIIAIYSGEDMKLWDEYYKYLYNDFLSTIKSNELRTLPDYRLLYVDSDYWNEALLALLISPLENNQKFIKEYLKIETIENIRFRFDKNKISNFPQNLVVDFVKKINPEIKNDIDISLDRFKELVESEYEYELFIKLIAATLSGLITDIEITFDQHLTTNSLSEGEKKQLLLRLILEILADENTLVLMDEPDANIHVANKIQIKTMLEEYPNRENILTTHSPTLMNIFENNLVYIEEGHVVGKEKAEVLQDIAGDMMSFAEQQIVLNSDSDILLVEGKTDIEYIKVALDKLKDEYSELSFNYIPIGGTDSLVHFIEKFESKNGQVIIALLDRDDAGKKALKQVFGEEKDITTFTYEKKDNTYIAVYPKTDGYEYSNFLVEDYFDKQIITKMAKEIIDDYSDSFKSYPNISKQIKQNLPTKCKYLEKDDFLGFKKLFDLIVEIKGQG